MLSIRSRHCHPVPLFELTEYAVNFWLKALTYSVAQQSQDVTSTRWIGKYAGVALLELMLLGLFDFLSSIVGVPAVESVRNEFSTVTETTTIETNLTVSDSNSIGISLGGGGGIQYYHNRY